MKIKVPIPDDPGPNPRANHGTPWDEMPRSILKRMFAEQADILQIAVVLGRSVGSVTEQLVREHLMWRDTHKGAYDCYWRNAPEAVKPATGLSVEHLNTQYLLTLRNEGGLYRTTSSLLRSDQFERYMCVVCTWIDKIAKERGEEVDPHERAYLVIELWDDQTYLLPNCPTYQSYVAARQLFLNRDPAAEEAEQPQPTNQEETTMSNTFPPLEVKIYVFGQNVKDMTADQLIDAIRKLETEIASLNSVKTQSKKIAAMIAKLEDAKAGIVALLDAIPD